ncbi:MAG: hypothetical protein JNM55_06750 [Anaerolineales bacterium]|nr:hypothetical protein [Anaerolineales bacterium]
MPIITSSHRELFRDPTTEDKLLLFRSLLDAKEDLTVDVALALLKTIHEELSNEQLDDRSLYKRYAEEIEALRFRAPAALQQVVNNWKLQKVTDPPEWFTYEGNDAYIK